MKVNLAAFENRLLWLSSRAPSFCFASPRLREDHFYVSGVFPANGEPNQLTKSRLASELENSASLLCSREGKIRREVIVNVGEMITDGRCRRASVHHKRVGIYRLPPP